jgi:flagellar biosynthesis protein FlhB
MAETDQEKTEAPTQRRRDEAREEGQVAKSQDLTAALAMVAAAFLLWLLGMQILTSMRTTMAVMLSGEQSANVARADDVAQVLSYATARVAEACGPLLLAMAVVVLCAGLLQVGVLVTGKPLIPRASKLSPLKGFKNLFNARAGMRLVMNLAKTAAIAAVGFVVIKHQMPRILLLAALEPLQMFKAACELIFALSLALAAILLILGLLDFAFQKWQRERDLRMTKQQIKEEMKRMEGDPLMKQRRGRVARQLALQRVNQAVPHADVVVTNPTHFAVALQYNRQTMTAPKVVAKGADYMAMRIRHLAAAHGVPMVERKELARALYAAVDVGQEVPPQFYGAVAEILAYIYRVSGRRSA